MSSGLDIQHQQPGQQWGRLKSEIGALYLLRNLPLHKVMDIMQENHAFFASERSYKARILEWGFEKNIKSTEMKYMARKSRKRKLEEGKETRFRVRSKAVDAKKIVRFIQDHRGIQWPVLMSPTPSVISYETIKNGPSGTSTGAENHPSPFGQVSRNIQKASCAKELGNGDLPAVQDSRSSSSHREYALPDSNYTVIKALPNVSKISSGDLNEVQHRHGSITPDLAAMKEFFDFSAAAKSDARSASSHTRTTMLRKNAAPGTPMTTGSKPQEAPSVVESEIDVMETLESLIELAGRVEDQGKYEWARVLLQRAVKHHQHHYDALYPSPLSALEALSRILRRQGRYNEAEKLLSGSLQAFRKTAGETDPNTADCLDLLALVMIAQGRLQEAENLARKSLKIRQEDKDVLGVCTSTETLGMVLGAQGYEIEAEKLHRTVLERRILVLGPDHPKTMNSMHHLAVSLGRQDKYDLMEGLYESMITIQERTIGPRHPHTLSSMHGVTSALAGQGRYQEAERRCRELVTLRQIVSGQEHPHTLAAMHNLAGIFMSQGLYERAQELFTHVIDVEKRTLGAEHPSTLTSLANLASVLECSGDDEDALALSREVLLSRQKVLGIEHPNTLNSKCIVARILTDMGEYGESLKLYAEVLAVRENVLGSHNWLSRAARRRIEAVEGLILDETAAVDSD